MSRPPRSKHFLQGNFAPVLLEQELADLPITGQFPLELSGTLYRVGPNPQHAPRDDHYHWFAGDGMIHAFSIEQGRVSYKNCWARTLKFEREKAAGKALFGTFGNPATSDPSVIGEHTGTANTNMVWHGNRLFALEESHLPFEIDAHGLASKGYQDFGISSLSRFTAHPKRDSQTGELHFFAYSPLGPGTCDVTYGVLDEHCKLTRQLAFKMPYASMVHDFSITANHVIFPITPLTTSMERAKRGEPLFAWEKDKHTHIGVLRKGEGPERIRWFSAPACHVFHFLNAWEEGDAVVAHLMEAQLAPGVPNADGSPSSPAQTAARLAQWRFDLGSAEASFERKFIDDLPAEFPRMDERHGGRQNQYGWYLCHADGQPRSDAESVLYGALAHYDFRSQKRALYCLPEGDVFSEAVFAPRTPDAAEGDGWLLTIAWREAAQRSDLLVLDALSIEQGPIATAHLPCRIPFGFHGTWRPNPLPA